MSTKASAQAAMIHACVFERGGELFGVEARVVVQIVFQPQLTVVPGAPAFVRGAMNLRGEIVPVVAIDGEIGVGSELPFPAQHPVLVLQTEYDLVAVPVERVLSVNRVTVTASGEQVDGKETARHVTAVCEWGGQVVAMLDHEGLISDLQKRVRSH